MKDHTFSVPCMIITDFVMEARPFFESQIKIKDSSRYLLSKIPVLQQSAVGSSLVGEFSLCTAVVVVAGQGEVLVAVLVQPVRFPVEVGVH